MSTVSKENYLKVIYNHIYSLGENASTVKLAQELSVSNAAISDMAKKLSQEGLISYKKYKGMELTDEGEKIALNVIRRHRLWELFLIKVLDLPWSQVHDQAEKLEHHTSDFLIDKIDEYLEYPEFDPHGHPIPRKNGSFPKSPKLMILADAEVGNEYEIIQVDDRDNKLIDYLSKVGLVLNTKLEVISKLEFDKSLTIKFGSQILSISQKISESIFVKSKEK
jgi:DtxR family Mn-dependent transcriptional regulator